MQQNSSFKQVIFRRSIGLSLLLHVLMLCFFVHFIHLPSPVIEKPSPNMYIPSYAINLPVPGAPPQKQPKQMIKDHPAPVEQNHIIDSKPQTDESMFSAQKPSFPPLVTKTADIKKSISKHIDKVQSLDKATNNEEPVHVIGKNKSDDPLVKLLGRAISARLIYPRTAADFNVKGTAYIGFTLHPNGELTGVRVMQSSGAAILDSAALRGIQAISPLGGANQYVPRERFLVVGIVFR